MLIPKRKTKMLLTSILMLVEICFQLPCRCQYKTCNYEIGNVGYKAKTAQFTTHNNFLSQ